MTPDPSPVSESLRTTVRRVGFAIATDGELVRRYATDRDDLAFAELVHRFAPAVYALCRRHLADPGTADDAFQAVFVLLARKAGTLAHPNRVGGWLTGVAARIARTARRRQRKQGGRFRPLDSIPEPTAEYAAPTELRAVLDDELAKLPPHYRAAVLLCDVEGMPRREAATRLNIPTATLGHRLTRGRAVLGRRLLRRGVLVAGGAVLVAHPPARLLAAAVRVALADSPPELLPLLQPMVPVMARAKQLLLLVGALALLGGGVTGVMLLVKGPTATPTSEGAPSIPPPPIKPTTPVTSAMSMEEVMRNQPKPRLPQDRTGAFAFTPDGGRMVTAPNDWSHEDSKVVVYDTANWKSVATLDIVREGAIVSGLAITPDGKRVFMAGFRGGNIRVWDAVANKFEEKQLDLGGLKFDRWRLRVSPDGKTLIAGMSSFDDGMGHYRVWDASTGETLRTLEAANTSADRFCFTDGGKTVAAVGWTTDKENRTAFVVERDIATGKETRRIDYAAAIGSDRGGPLSDALTYTADGKHVVIGGGFRLPDEPPLPLGSYRSTYPYSGSVWVIDRETGKLVKTLIEHRYDLVRELHLSTDGNKLIVCPALPSRWARRFESDYEFVEVQQWDVATWELDWVKIVPKAERWKLWNGAAK